MKDIVVMNQLCSSAADALQAGLRHARSEDPHVYAEIVDLVEKGLAAPEMVIRFKPDLTVSFRVVPEAGEPIEVFSYGGPAADSFQSTQRH